MTAARPVASRHTEQVRARRAAPVRPAAAAPLKRRAVARPAGRIMSRARRVAARPAGRAMRLLAVTRYARAQVGARYRMGATGPHQFDCSGLVMRAYRRAGVLLPHSSGGIARRADPVARSRAQPGDLVVGHGHVGIYMGRGMMVDAGNRRVGVVYRRVYRGLWIERLL